MIFNVPLMNYNRENLVGLFWRLFADSLPLIIFLLFILLHVPQKDVNLSCATLTTSKVDKHIKPNLPFCSNDLGLNDFVQHPHSFHIPRGQPAFMTLPRTPGFERPNRKPDGRKRLWRNSTVKV